MSTSGYGDSQYDDALSPTAARPPSPSLPIASSSEVSPPTPTPTSAPAPPPPPPAVPHALNRSRDHSELLDTIDKLRSQGLSGHVSLPQLIVCGDQSAGKSSVLEAVSGVRFPTKDTLCTRFATELVLRRSPETEVRVSITPGTSRSLLERSRISAFTYPNAKLEDVPDIIEKAKARMHIGEGTKAFSDDILRIDISGPTQPHLTLIDSPGVIHSSNVQQSETDIQTVKNLVKGYMENPRSIILAVVSAKNDYANQIVTKLARDVDPEGLRTLGVITKPDTLHPGSNSEKAFFDLATNKEVHLSLGWHVLKNRDWDKRDASSEERDKDEKEFFRQGIWTLLPANYLGIESLTPRLSKVLKDHIIKELPDLIHDVTAGIENCQERLSNLGPARGTLEQQRLYLINISQHCRYIIKAAVDGNYIDEFFRDPSQTNGNGKRLRAILQDHLSAFRQDIGQNGHAMNIIDDETSYDRSDPRCIRRTDYIDEVRDLLKKTKGRELPGLFNPLLVGDLFFQQSKPWSHLAELYRTKIVVAVSTCLDLVLVHCTDQATREGLQRYVFRPAVEQLARDLNTRISELLKPHQQGHLITYNPEFARNVQQIRNQHNRRYMQKKLYDIFSTSSGRDSEALSEPDYIKNLVDQLSESSEDDQDISACSQATDCMLGYYKAALELFVDNYASLAIETCLIEKLCDIFTPETVMQLPGKLIESIAAEPEVSQIERSRATSKLESLESGMDILQTLSRYGSTGNEVNDEPSSSAAGSNQSNGVAQNVTSPPTVAVTSEQTTAPSTHESQPWAGFGSGPWPVPSAGTNVNTTTPGESPFNFQYQAPQTVQHGLFTPPGSNGTTPKKDTGVLNPDASQDRSASKSPRRKSRQVSAVRQNPSGQYLTGEASTNDTSPEI